MHASRARSPGLAPEGARFKRHRSRSGSRISPQSLTGWLPRSNGYQPLSQQPELQPDRCHSRPSKPRVYAPEAVHAGAFDLEATAGASDGLPNRKTLRKAAKSQAKHTSSQLTAEEEPIGLLGFLIESWYLTWMFVFIPIGFIAYHAHLG